MKLPPFAITTPIQVDYDPRTGGVVLTAVPDMGTPLGLLQDNPCVLRLTKAVRTQLLVALRAIETDPGDTTGLRNTPGSLQ